MRLSAGKDHEAYLETGMLRAGPLLPGRKSVSTSGARRQVTSLDARPGNPVQGASTNSSSSKQKYEAEFFSGQMPYNQAVQAVRASLRFLDVASPPLTSPGSSNCSNWSAALPGAASPSRPTSRSHLVNRSKASLLSISNASPTTMIKIKAVISYSNQVAHSPSPQASQGHFLGPDLSVRGGVPSRSASRFGGSGASSRFSNLGMDPDRSNRTRRSKAGGSGSKIHPSPGDPALGRLYPSGSVGAASSTSAPSAKSAGDAAPRPALCAIPSGKGLGDGAAVVSSAAGHPSAGTGNRRLGIVIESGSGSGGAKEKNGDAAPRRVSLWRGFFCCLGSRSMA